MGADGDISPHTTTGARAQSQPRMGRLSRAERVQFATDPPHLDSQDHLATVTETDNLSNLSSVMDSWDTPGVDDSMIWDKKTVLSCSGGGVRALFQLYLLGVLMGRVASFEQSLDENNKATSSADSPLLRFRSDKSDQYQPRSRVQIVEGTYLPCHYFDYIGGTSVGGIIAVMFGRLRLSVNQAIRNFERIWLTMAATMSRLDRIVPFRKAKTSNSRSLDRAFGDLLTERKERLNEFFQLHINSAIDPEAGSDEFASDPELCKTIVIAMPDETEGGLQRPHFFRTSDYQGEGSSSLSRSASGSTIQDRDGANILIRDVCKATSAAPGFFKGVSIGGMKFRDGAIWTSNPALEICSDIEEAHSGIKEPIQLLVSLGSGGQKPRKLQAPAQKQYRSRSDEESIDRKLTDKLDSRYCAFEGPSDLSGLEINEWRIDGSGLKTFARIRKSTEAYCKRADVKEKIDSCAKTLVRLRQSRARTTRWERFALGIRYTCRVNQTCSSRSQKFEDRDAFMDHLMWEHNEPPQDEANWNRIERLLASSQITTVK